MRFVSQNSEVYSNGNLPDSPYQVKPRALNYERDILAVEVVYRGRLERVIKKFLARHPIRL